MGADIEGSIGLVDETERGLHETEGMPQFVHKVCHFTNPRADTPVL